MTTRSYSTRITNKTLYICFKTRFSQNRLFFLQTNKGSGYTQYTGSLPVFTCLLSDLLCLDGRRLFILQIAETLWCPALILGSKLKVPKVIIVEGLLYSSQCQTILLGILRSYLCMYVLRGSTRYCAIASLLRLDTVEYRWQSVMKTMSRLDEAANYLGYFLWTTLDLSN